LGTLLSIVGPVFLLIGLGWFAAWRGLIDRAGFAGLNRFAFGFCAPALLFLGGTSGQAGAGPATLGFFVGASVFYAVVLLVARLRLPLGEAGVLALDATYGNAVMMGIPLILAAFGEQALALLLGIIALHSLVLLAVATIIAEIALHQHAPWRRVLRSTLGGIARNPVVMAVLVGFIWHQAGLPPPTGIARRTLELLGGATAPAALVCLGGSLLGFDARAAWTQAALTCALKLLALPAVVWGVALLLGLGPLETAVAVVAAALPTGANSFMLAQRYGIRPELSGATVLVSTVLSLVTLSLLIAHFRV